MQVSDDAAIDAEMVPKDAMTDLPSGERVSKDDLRMEACGTVDELNSHIGLLVADSCDAVQQELQDVQRKLFAVGAYLVGVKDVPHLPSSADVQFLKRRIAEISKDIGAFEGFVLPGGCRQAAQAHVCRTVCRRAERRIVELHAYAILPYMNRLSTYFFYLAKFLNNFYGRSEIKL